MYIETHPSGLLEVWTEKVWVFWVDCQMRARHMSVLYISFYNLIGIIFGKHVVKIEMQSKISRKVVLSSPTLHIASMPFSFSCRTLETKEIFWKCHCFLYLQFCSDPSDTAVNFFFVIQPSHFFVYLPWGYLCLWGNYNFEGTLAKGNDLSTSRIRDNCTCCS